MSGPYRIAVVGATGQVGTLMLKLLRERALIVRGCVGIVRVFAWVLGSVH